MFGPEEQVVFAAPLLNRFPSIEGDEEDGEEQLQDGEEQLQGENENDRSVVHEEERDCRRWLKVDEVDEGWSRVRFGTGESLGVLFSSST